MSDDTDYSSLSIEERLVHKVWKVRLEAYGELTKQFENSRNENDSCFLEYNNKLDLFKKFISDSNVVAQESAINAFAKYLEYGGNTSNIAKLKALSVVTVLCEKTLSSARKNTKDYAITCLLLMIEKTTDINGIIEDILPLLKHRLPKLVAGSISALLAIVENYGCQVISPKLIIPSLSKLFAHADKTVRAETTKLTVELYKWMGASLETILFPELKPVQQKDMTALFESVKGESVEQKRFTKTQQEEILRRREEEAAVLAAADANGQNADVEMTDASNNTPKLSLNPYDIAEPVDVLSKFPSDFHSRLSSAKWKDRKEVLEEVYAILEKSTRVVVDDYSTIIRAFAKCMKDANIQVVQLAANNLEFLMKALQKDFQIYSSIVLGPMIERTKEKKASVSSALEGALDSLFDITSLSDILDETLNGMKNKTPQIKISSTNYLQRCLAQTKIQPSSAEIDNIMGIGVKLLSDSQEPVRQASTEMIGTLMKITGERELNTFLEKIDENRKAKVFAFFEKVTVKSKLGSTVTPKQTLSQPSRNVGSTSSSNKKLTMNPTTKKMGPDFSGPSIPAKRGATSPVKRDEDTQKISSFGRGLTGRSLASLNTPAQPVSVAPTVPKSEQPISSVELQEFQSLRKEKEEWLVQKQKQSMLQIQASEDKLLLTQEISQLKVKNEGLHKDHTNALLMVKQKDSQILRLNSDLENAKLKIRGLEQTIEMMKLQQNQTQAKQSYNSYYLPNSHTSYDQKKSLRSPDLNSLRINSGELSSRVNRLSIEGESLRENLGSSNLGNITIGNYENSQEMTDNTNTFEVHASNDIMDLDANADSWRRAAEVTSQLKARIEKMRARTRNGI